MICSKIGEKLGSLKILNLCAYAINLLKLSGYIYHQSIVGNIHIILSEISLGEYKTKLINSGLCIYFENYTFILKSNGIYEIYFTKNIHELENDFIEKIKKIIRTLIIKFIDPNRVIKNLSKEIKGSDLYKYCVYIKLDCLNAQLIADTNLLDKKCIYDTLKKNFSDVFLKSKCFDSGIWLTSSLQNSDLCTRRGNPIMVQSLKNKFCYIANPNQHNIISWGEGCFFALSFIDKMMVELYPRCWFSHFSVLNLQNDFTNFDLYRFMLDNDISASDAYDIITQHSLTKHNHDLPIESNEPFDATLYEGNDITSPILDIAELSEDAYQFVFSPTDLINPSEPLVSQPSTSHDTTLLEQPTDIMDGYGSEEQICIGVQRGSVQPPFQENNCIKTNVATNGSHEKSDIKIDCAATLVQVYKYPSVYKLQNKKLFKSKEKLKREGDSIITSNIISERTKLKQLTPSSAKYIKQSINTIHIDTCRMQKAIIHTFTKLVKDIKKIDSLTRKTFCDLNSHLLTLKNTIKDIEIDTSSYFETTVNDTLKSGIVPKLSKCSWKTPCGRNAGKDINQLRSALIEDLNVMIDSTLKDN